MSLLFLSLFACTSTPDTGADTDDTGQIAYACHQDPGAVDKERAVIVSRPYTAAGGQADTWEVLSLDSAGTITSTGTTFEMGRSTLGEVVFTPDGALGLAVQDDGTVGLFSLDDQLAPTVLDAGFGDGAFYASQVVMGPTGEHFWVVDGNWAENGGGLYRVDLGCDGAPGTPELVVDSKLAASWMPAGSLYLAKEVGTSGPGAEVYHLDGATVLDSASVWESEDVILSHGALSPDGQHLAVAENSAFSGLPNSVVVLDSGLSVLHRLEVEDPVWVWVTDQVVLVSSGYGDSVHALQLGSGDSTEVASAELPGALVGLRRGPLDGLVLVAENTALHRLQISGTQVQDLGTWDAGSGVESILGAVGVQP